MNKMTREKIKLENKYIFKGVLIGSIIIIPFNIYFNSTKFAFFVFPINLIVAYLLSVIWNKKENKNESEYLRRRINF